MDAAIVTSLHLIAFLGTGVSASFILFKQKILPKQYLLIAGYAISALVGFGLFFMITGVLSIAAILYRLNTKAN